MGGGEAAVGALQARQLQLGFGVGFRFQAAHSGAAIGGHCAGLHPIQIEQKCRPSVALVCGSDHGGSLVSREFEQ